MTRYPTAMRLLAWTLLFTLMWPAPAGAAHDTLRPLSGAETPVTASGLEEGFSRPKLMATLAVGLAILLGVGYFAFRDRFAPPSPMKATGALAPLRQWLGPSRELGIIIWDPGDIFKVERLRQEDLFKLAVQRGIDTVWISGFRFRSLTPAQQQRLVDQADKAGLKTLGFIDGDAGWADNATWVANHYTELLGQLKRLKLGRLHVAFGTDVEPYTQQDAQGRPSWNGNLTGYMDLLNDTIFPKVWEFARNVRHPEGGSVVREPYVVRWEPWWYENGRVMDHGARISGLRSVPGMGLASMTYRGNAAELVEFSGVVRRRAREDGAPFRIGVETIPSAEAGTPSFAGKEREIGAALLGAVSQFSADDRGRFGGVYIHTRGPLAALRVLHEQVETSTALPDTGGQPATVAVTPALQDVGPVDHSQAAVVVVRLNWEKATFTLSGVREGSLAVLFAENDLKGEPGVWYRQPTGEKTWVVQGGQVTVENSRTGDALRPNRFYVFIVKDTAAVETLQKWIAVRSRGDPTFFSRPTLQALRTDQVLAQQTGLVIVTATSATQGQRLKSGLEEVGPMAARQAADAIRYRMTLMPQKLLVTEKPLTVSGDQPILGLTITAPTTDSRGRSPHMAVNIYLPRDGSSGLDIWMTPGDFQGTQVPEAVLEALQLWRTAPAVTYDRVMFTKYHVPFDPLIIQQRQALMKLIDDETVTGARAAAEGQEMLGGPVYVLFDRDLTAEHTLGRIDIPDGYSRALSDGGFPGATIILKGASAEDYERLAADSTVWGLVRVARQGAPPVSARGHTVHLTGLAGGRELPDTVIPAVVTAILAQHPARQEGPLLFDITPFLALDRLTVEDVWQVLTLRFA